MSVNQVRFNCQQCTSAAFTESVLAENNISWIKRADISKVDADYTPKPFEE